LEDFSEHERDAVLAAVAIREGMTGAWSHDLSVKRDDDTELDPKRMWFGEVSYFWPPLSHQGTSAAPSGTAASMD